MLAQVMEALVDVPNNSSSLSSDPNFGTYKIRMGKPKNDYEIYKKMKHFFYILVLLSIIFSCKSRDENDIDEQKIIEKIINEKIYSLAYSKVIQSIEFRKENLQNSENEKKRDSIIKNRKFYFYISDTLQVVDIKSDLYKAAIKQFVFIPEQNQNALRVLNISKLSIRKNLIRTNNKKDDYLFLGHFKFSRVIFGEKRKRALVFIQSEGTTSFFPVIELEKYNNDWIIK